jgi:hypothetical protein
MKRISLLLVLVIAGTIGSLRAEDAGDIAPRNGKYMIYSFGAVGNAPLFLGYFVLADGSYKAFLPGDKVYGEGKYSYDKAKHEVTWLSGPYAGAYGGTFTVESGGKRHKLRLKSTTVATNEG